MLLNLLAKDRNVWRDNKGTQEVLDHVLQLTTSVWSDAMTPSRVMPNRRPIQDTAACPTCASSQANSKLKSTPSRNH